MKRVALALCWIQLGPSMMTSGDVGVGSDFKAEAGNWRMVPELESWMV